MVPYKANLLAWKVTACLAARSQCQAASCAIHMQVEGGKIQRMEVLGNKGAGPRALFEALGGKIQSY